MLSILSRPKLSIIVVCFNMRREAERTLFTLSNQYQKAVSDKDYEVIVIDNGSAEPLDPGSVKRFGKNFRYHFHNTQSPSPALAVNTGARLARGKYLACIVDGARMVTPEIVSYTLKAINAFNNPFICSLAWHLGPKEQNYSMLEGYNQAEEDKLLLTIDWQQDGYKLFDISSQASSSAIGIFGGLPEECSYFAMTASGFQALGGYDEQFQSPGGGFINHDFVQRVVSAQTFDLTVLAGEGSFHQFHGGIATNALPEEHPRDVFAKEYELIRGKPFRNLIQPPHTEINYLGCKRKETLRFMGVAGIHHAPPPE